jgi:hypothetical protein
MSRHGSVRERSYAFPSSGERHRRRLAHAGPGQRARDGRLAVAGSKKIMRVGRVPAQARRDRRRLDGRWCCRGRWDRHKRSQPHPGRRRNDQSRMSPSPRPIASTGDPRLRRGAGGHSTISGLRPASAQRRSGGRSPRSEPGRAGSATHPNRPPSRSSGRPQGSLGAPGRAGSSGSRPSGAGQASGRRGARSAAASRLGSRPARLVPCSGHRSWPPLPFVMEMPGRSIIHE